MAGRSAPTLHAFSMMAIAIGVGVPLRGPSAALGREMMNAVALAVEEHSSGSPKIELVIVDDEGVTKIGAQRARELCARGDVVGVVGHYQSDVTISASEIYAEHGMAMITPVASNPVVTERRLPHVFRFTNRDDRTAAAIASHLCHVLGRRRGVIVATSSLYGRSMAGEFARAFSRAGGSIAQRFDIGEGERALDRVVASELRQVAEIDVDGHSTMEESGQATSKSNDA